MDKQIEFMVLEFDCKDKDIDKIGEELIKVLWKYDAGLYKYEKEQA